jgi:hypothetical protein
MEEVVQKLLLLREAVYTGRRKADGSIDKRCLRRNRPKPKSLFRIAVCNNLVKAREKMRLIREADKACD